MFLAEKTGALPRDGVGHRMKSRQQPDKRRYDAIAPSQPSDRGADVRMVVGPAREEIGPSPGIGGAGQGVMATAAVEVVGVGNGANDGVAMGALGKPGEVLA